ncbi:hypothetical protein MMC16_000174 [Acarospora aff. strigata]|nr:hypothetical protein [Acarospora aff. strigata]
MGKPKGGGSKAIGGNAKAVKRTSLSLPSDKKRQAESSVAAIHPQSAFNLPQRPQQVEGTLRATSAEQHPALSLVNSSAMYPNWHDYPWDVTPPTPYSFYPHSGLDDAMETTYPLSSWMGSIPMPIDPKYPSGSTSSRSSPTSDLDLEIGNPGTDQLSEDITSWWDYCRNSGMASAMTPMSDSFGSASCMPELALLTPTSSMFGQTPLSAHPNHSFPMGEPHKICATQCNHYLSLLQNLATIERVLHSSHPHPGPVPHSPGLKAVHSVQAQSSHPSQNNFSRGKRDHLDLSFDHILALAKETLRQSAGVLKCEACLGDSSCLLMFAVLSEKVVGLYQAGAGAYGIYGQARILGEQQNYSRDQGGSGGVAMGQIATCQTSKICVGKHELEPAEERVLVKNLLKSRLKEMTEILDRLRTVIENLPGDGGQASACQNALGHAWGKLGFVSGMVD